MGMIEDVAQFQKEILGNEFEEKKGFDGQLMMETITRLDEEIGELENSVTLADEADALIDLIYFALGALYQAGVDTQRAWDEVHRANMTKKKGITKRGDDNDAAKPEGWQAPDLSWLDRAI